MNLWPVFQHLLRLSFQASVLVLLVLLAQAAFRNYLSARWRYALWTLVLVRLLLPASLESRFSLFGVAPSMAPTVWTAEPLSDGRAFLGGASAGAQATVERAATPPEVPGSNPSETELSPPVPVSSSYDKSGFWSHSDWKAALSILWLGGAAGLGLLGLWRSFRFGMRLRNAQPIRNAEATAVLDDSRRAMGVTKAVALLETDAVISPALYGFFHNRLLLPPGILGTLSPTEFRHVFLHELAHVRRRDMLVNWITGALCVAHWFNPLLWLAFRRIEADRELACDELVLSVTGADSNHEYGCTIIKLMERTLGRLSAPGAVGISESQHHLERRMTMIANFNPDRKGALIAIPLLIILGMATLTDGRTAASENRALPASQPEPSSSPGSAEEAAALLTRLGAEITRDEESPGKPVTRISMTYSDPSRRQTQTFSFDNANSYRHYRLTVFEVQDDEGTNAPADDLRRRRSMQLSEIQLLDAENRDVTRPGDPIFASSTNSPPGEEVAHAIDDQSAKYLNFDTAAGSPAGFVISPSAGLTRVAGLSIASANDFPSRDPKVVTLEGSNDAAVIGWDTGNWTSIARIVIPSWTELWPRRLLTPGPGEVYFDAFDRLPELRELTVEGGLLEDEGMRRLSKLPNLEKLIVAGRTWLTDRGMAHLADFPKLTHLDLYETTEVTDRGMRYLAGRTQMRRVGLLSSRISGQSGITDRTCAYLKGMSNLTSLFFMGTRMTDKGLEHFAGLTNLTFINLSATPFVTGEGLKHFREPRIPAWRI